MKNYELPNGEIAEFPDDMSEEEIEAAVRKEFPPTKHGSVSQKSESQTDHDAVVRYGLKDPLVGLLNFGSRGATSAGNLGIELINKLGGKLPKQEAADFSEMFGLPKEKNIGDIIGQFAGEVAPALLAPETEIPWVSKALMKLPAWGKYLKSALGNAVTQGAIAGSQSPENRGEAALEAGGIAAPFSALSEAIKSGNPTVRNISRILGGLGAGGLGYYGAKSVGAPEPAADLAAILGASLGGRGGNTERRVRENMFKGINPSDYPKIEEMQKAASELGLSHLTPAETLGYPSLGAAQGNIGKTEGGAQLLYERGQKRLGEENKAIEDLFGNIFPKTLEERKNALYKASESQEIPEDNLSKFEENEIFKTALKHVKNEPAYKEKLKGVSENSVQYLNQIKEAMDDMIEKAPKKEGSIIRETKNNLLKTIDAISPEYKEARQLAERGMVRKEIEDLFNKKEETGTNLFKTLLSNKRDYTELQNRFKRLEETASTDEQMKSMKAAQQQLQNMKKIFGQLINVPTAKTAEALSRSSMSKPRASITKMMEYWQEIMSGGKYDKAAVELITNPKWTDELSKLGEITKKDKLVAAFHNLLGKASGQAIAQ